MSGRGNDAGRGGFTLVELLVAAAVFAIGVASLTPLLVSQVRANDAAAIRTEAVALAQEKIEEFRALPFDGGSGTGQPDILGLADGSETVGRLYTRSWHKADAPGPAADAEDLKRISVTVSWAVPSRTSGSVTLLTARARY